MSKSGRIAKHTGILMFMEFGVRSLDALVSVILARYLAPKGFGLLAFALSFSWLFSILPGFGMGSLVTRNVAQDPRQLSRYVSNGLYAKILLAIVTLLVMGLTAWILGYSIDKCYIVLLAGLLMVAETNVRFTLSFFQAVQRMSTVAAVNLGVRAGWVVGSMAIVALKGGINELLGVRVFVTAAGLIASVVLVDRRLQRIKWNFDPVFIWQILKASIPFALFRLYGQVYTDIDTVMLSTMRGDIMTGWYAAANKLLRVFAFIPTGFFGATLPAMSKYSRESHVDLEKTITNSAKYLVMIALPINAGAFAIADQLILTLYGREYLQAIPALRILTWSILFTFLNSVMTASIAAINKEWKGGTYLMMGALFSSLSNLVVVPLFGHLGAASTTFMAEVFIFTLQFRLLKKTLPHLNLLSGMIKTFIAAAVMMLVAWLFRGRGLIVTIPIACLVYVGCLIALRAVGLKEWHVLREMMRKRSQKKQAENIPEIKAGKQTPKITIHCRVRNEERFVHAALLSVLPLAERVLVYDTGSTDRTLDEIASIQSDKIEIVHKPPSDAKGIMEYRNEMIDRTTTEWFMLVDGDEVYPAETIPKIREEMPRVPSTTHRIIIHRKHFIENFNFISPTDGLGRIYRTDKIKFRFYDPTKNKVGQETPYLPKDPQVPIDQFSTSFPGDIFFFHCHHLNRSSKDRELGKLRGWRRPPFPAIPYFGPWPEELEINGADRHMTPKIFYHCINLNTKILSANVVQTAQKMKRKVQEGKINFKHRAQKDHAND